MKKLFLFCDGSVYPQTKVGFGAYMLLQEDELVLDIKPIIKIKKFEDTSSTKLELETFLWAIKEIDTQGCDITVYTDCQNLLSLERRKEGFEATHYHTKSGKLINNHALYKEFFTFTNSFTCKFVKVQGHKKKETKDNIDKLFSLVDKSSRNALREYLS